MEQLSKANVTQQPSLFNNTISLSKEDKQVVLNAINRLDSLIEENDPDNCHLFVGDLGKSLFFAYQHTSRQQPALEKALKIVDHHIQKANDFILNYKFAYGLTGLLWVIQFLANKNLLSQNEVGDLEEVDEYVITSLKWDFEDALYDLFIGYIGKGLYLMERFESSKGNDTHRKALESIVDNLSDRCVALPGKECSWLDDYTSYYEEHRDKESYFNLDLSHGVPSIIVFLAHCVRLGIQTEKAHVLIDSAIRWIESLEQQGKYPHRLYQDGERVLRHRDLSWSYGKFSIAVSCWVAGKALNCTKWEEKALEVLRQAAQISLEEACLPDMSYGPDISFCNGSIGNAHLFLKFFRLTGDPELENAARYWLKETLDRLPQVPDETLQKDSGLLFGAAGIANILLGFYEQSKADRGPEFNWDRMFLSDLEAFQNM